MKSRAIWLMLLLIVAAAATGLGRGAAGAPAGGPKPKPAADLPATVSQLMGIPLPAGAVRRNSKADVGGATDVLALYGPPMAQQAGAGHRLDKVNDVECLAWSGPSYKASQNGNTMRQVEAALKTAGYSVAEGKPSSQGGVKIIPLLISRRPEGQTQEQQTPDFYVGTWIFARHLILAWGRMVLVSASDPGATAPTSDVPAKPVLRVETGMHVARINGVSTDAAGRYVVTGSQDKTVRVWDAATGALLSVLRPPIAAGSEGEIDAVAISPDGATIACGGWTGETWDHTTCVYLLDRDTGKLLRRLPGLEDVITQLAFSPDGRFLAATVISGLVTLWRTSDYARTGVEGPYGDQSYGASFGLTGKALCLGTTSYDGYLRLYAVASDGVLTLKVEKKAPGGKHPVDIDFSPDGTKVAVGYSGSTKVSVLSGSDLSSLYAPDTNGITGDLGSVSWSADGNVLYAGGKNIGLTGGNVRSLVRRWSEGGRGAHTDLAAAQGLITEFCPRVGGGVFFAAEDPAWGALDGGGVLGNPVIAELSDRSLFRVSPDGATVSFPFQEGVPAMFSLRERTITPGAASSSLRLPILSGAGMDVQNWHRSGTPTLNGKTLDLALNERSRSLAIAPDLKTFLLGTEFRLRCFGKDGRQRWGVDAPGKVWSVNVSGNGKVAVAAYSDGTIRWYRMADGRNLAALFPHADRKRWVLWTPSGYYDCSPGGEELLGWHLNHGKEQAADFFPVSRFRDTYYRPDVLAQALTAPSEAEALRLADAETGRKPAAVAVETVLPPVVTILSPESGAAVSSDRVTVRYSLRTPSGEPVTYVKVLVDGRPAGADRDLHLVPAETNTAQGLTRETAVIVPHKDCTVSVIASNSHGAGEPASVGLHWTGATVKATELVPEPGQAAEFVIKPTLYLLAVGVSQYQDTALHLGYSAKDAHDFAVAMQTQKGTLYKDVVVKEVTDAAATKDNILDGLDWLQKSATSNDVAMLFLSGHGANDSNGKYFFLPADFDRDKIKRTGLPWTDVVSTVQDIPGKVIVFNDSCHSGNVLGGATKGLQDTTAAVNELISAENGAVVFSAATGSEVAREDEAWGNGAFTKALVEGILGKADYDHSGRITVNMLALYIPERVKALTSGAQHPTGNKPPTVRDFPLALVAPHG